jgi:hypothetical protein
MIPMDVVIHVPDTIFRRLQEQWGEGFTRHMLESWVLEDYRVGRLTTEEVRQLLGFETRFEVHGFLKVHGVPLYTLEAFEEDIATLEQRLHGSRLSHSMPHQNSLR